MITTTVRIGPQVPVNILLSVVVNEAVLDASVSISADVSEIKNKKLCLHCFQVSTGTKPRQSHN